MSVREIMMGFAVTLLTLSAATAASTADEKGPFIKLRIRGQLQHGLLAIGGETTGTAINAKGMTFELELSRAKWLQRVEKFNGKQVVVAGTLESRKGIEVGNRLILHVTELKRAEKKDFIRVEAKGELLHGAVAIGGETTGTMINCGQLTLEIALAKPKLASKAEQLSGQTVKVQGELQLRQTVEIPQRLVILAEKIREI